MAEASKPTQVETTPTEPIEEKLSQEITVKNISKASVFLLHGEIKPGEKGKCSKAEFENFVGIYIEKA